jgi:hypothetical protein
MHKEAVLADATPYEPALDNIMVYIGVTLCPLNLKAIVRFVLTISLQLRSPAIKVLRKMHVRSGAGATKGWAIVPRGGQNAPSGSPLESRK